MNPKYSEQIYAATVAGKLADGRKVVTVAGTAEAVVSASTPCRKVVLTALAGNTNAVCIGASTVVAALATRRGIPLLASQALTVYVDDLSKLYIDAITSGEGVSFAYFI